MMFGEKWQAAVIVDLTGDRMYRVLYRFGDEGMDVPETEIRVPIPDESVKSTANIRQRRNTSLDAFLGELSDDDDQDGGDGGGDGGSGLDSGKAVTLNRNKFASISLPVEEANENESEYDEDFDA